MTKFNIVLMVTQRQEIDVEPFSMFMFESPLIES